MMANRSRRVLSIMMLLSLAVMIALLVAAGLKRPQDKPDYLKERATHLSAGWTLASGEAVTLPADLGHKGAATLKRTLPATNWDSCLLITTSFQQVVVAVDGAEVFRAGHDQYQPFDQEQGILYSIVPLGPGEAGRTLTITYGAPYDGSSQVLRDVLLGDRTVLLVDAFKDNLPVFALCLLLVLGAAVFLVLCAITPGRSADNLRGDFLCLGVAMLLVAAWLITDDAQLPLFIGHDELMFLLTMFSFTLLPVPFLLFVRRVVVHGHKLLGGLAALSMANFLVQCALYVLNVTPMLSLLRVTHVLMAASIAAVSTLCLREQFVYKRAQVRGINWGLYALLAGSATALALFYTDGAAQYYTTAFRYGVLLFTALLFATAISRSAQLLRHSVRAELYRTLAYKDMMTGLSNRTAYEQMLGNLPKDSPKQVGFAMFDLNNLKETNDQLGHRAGDALIKAAGQLIKEAFAPQDRVYRIGGDEFVAVVEGANDQAMIDRLNRLDQLLGAHNKTCAPERKVLMSSGYACGPANTPEALSELTQRADAAMYREKRGQA